MTHNPAATHFENAARPSRRTAPRLVASGVAIALSAVLGLVAPAAAAGAQPSVQGGDVNQAVAVNTKDGDALFRFAFSIRRVTDGVVDQENLATAYASCTDCQTVALAFQIILVVGGADVVTVTNEAVAYNEQCAECLTFASATQIVLGVDGPVKLTKDGEQRLHDLQKAMKDLEAQLPTMSASQLVTRVSSFEAQVIEILSSELVPAGKSDEEESADAAVVSTTMPGSSTIVPTTIGHSTSTSSSGTTTSTARPAVTTTTTPPSGTGERGLGVSTEDGSG
jgi:putative peptide zinc metalloprotease protein